MATISKIDDYVIQEVKRMREKNELSQMELSIQLNRSEGFVGHVENPKRREKYNLTHVNLLAEIFGCSPRDLLPEKPL